MSEFVLYGKLNCVNEGDLAKIFTTPDYNNTGYILEVDLHFPIEPHEKFREYPPTPETLTPELERLRDY